MQAGEDSSHDRQTPPAGQGEGWRYEPGHWDKQRLVEGEDYRRWHEEHAGRHSKRGSDREHDDRH